MAETSPPNIASSSVAGQNKRPATSPPSDHEDDVSPDAFAKMSRSERKRHREKKRRQDVNRGFEDLMALLVEIDPSIRSHVEEHRTDAQDGSLGGLNRVELISRTVSVLGRIHRENEHRKMQLDNLARRGTTLQGTPTDGRVAMMFPYLTPNDSSMLLAARRSQQQPYGAPFLVGYPQAPFGAYPGAYGGSPYGRADPIQSPQEKEGGTPAQTGPVRLVKDKQPSSTNAAK